MLKGSCWTAASRSLVALTEAMLVVGRQEEIWTDGVPVPLPRNQGRWVAMHAGWHELWQLQSWRRVVMNFPVGHYNFMGVICFAL